MATKHQARWISIPKAFDAFARRLIATEILDKIRANAARGLDKNGMPFRSPTYSAGYRKSTQFKLVKGSQRKVDLTLTGNMLAALQLLDDQPGKIRIGYEDGTQENAIADGNIRGTYGKQRGNSRLARDFLGLPSEQVKQIISRYKGKTNFVQLASDVNSVDFNIEG